MKIITEANLETIKTELRRMLNDGIHSPEVREAAIGAMVEGDEIASIFNWAKGNFNYVPDPYGRELFISPRKMLEKYQSGIMSGDCDDAALLIASLLGSVGYETKISLLDCDFDGDYDHAVGRVYSPEINYWIFLDLTSKNPLGWVESYAKKTDIEM